MPTEVARSPTPSVERAETPGMNSRDRAPLSIAALAIIAALVVILHIAGADLIYQSRAHASAFGPDAEAKCPPDTMPATPSLPFD
jgi:hypothetical protein